MSQNQPPSIPPYQGGGLASAGAGGGLATADEDLPASGRGLSPSLDKGRAGEGFAFDSGEGFAFDSAYLPYNKNLTTLARENRSNPTAA